MRTEKGVKSPRCTSHTQPAGEPDAGSFQDQSEQGCALQTPVSSHRTCCFLALKVMEANISGLGDGQRLCQHYR